MTKHTEMGIPFIRGRGIHIFIFVCVCVCVFFFLTLLIDDDALAGANEVTVIGNGIRLVLFATISIFFSLLIRFTYWNETGGMQNAELRKQL